MPSPKSLVYWDSCCFLSYVNKDPLRHSHLAGIIGDDDIEIITSVASITEVAFGAMELMGGPLDKASEDAINESWAKDSPVVLVEFYDLIAEDAKALIRRCREAGFKVTPLDAIHLATADRWSVEEFHTYDGSLPRCQPHTKTQFKIVTPVARNPAIIFPTK
jgi:predicted nucleic acid-binding protein